MTVMTLYVGVDVSKQTLVAATCSTEQAVVNLGSFANSDAGIAQLLQTVRTLVGQAAETEMQLVVEPTGSYHLALVVACYADQWQVSAVNPQRVRAWANGLGRRAKTDAVDARTLAQYGLHCTPPAQHPLPEAVAELEQLLRRQEDLEQMLHQEQRRQEGLGRQPQAVRNSLHQMQEALQQQLRDLEAAIAALLAQHPELAQQRRQLLSVPGIGVRNVLHMLVLFYRWNAYTAGQGDAKGLTAYVGLDPVSYTSGTSIHKHPAISRMGSTDLRRRFYLSALGGTHARHSPLTVFYHRLLAHAKPKMVALIACARKILVWGWAVFCSDSFFDPARAFPKGGAA